MSMETHSEPLKPPPKPKVKRRKKRGPKPRAPFKIPDFIVTRGLPVGSIAKHLQPFRKQFNDLPASWIAIQAMAKVAKDHFTFPKIIECWALIPKSDQRKVLALDYIVEQYGWKLYEFIDVIKAVLTREIIEMTGDEQTAAMPQLMAASIKAAIKSKDPKERIAHLQRANFIDKPPKMGGVTVNAPTMVNIPAAHQLPSAEDFAKRLDNAVRAGRETLALPEAPEDAVDAVVLSETPTPVITATEMNEIVDQAEMEQGPDYKQEEPDADDSVSQMPTIAGS